MLRGRIAVADMIACHLTGIPALATQEGHDTLQRVSMRPIFEILGLPGGSRGKGQETVIPARVPSIRVMADDFERVFCTRSLWLRGSSWLPTVNDFREALAAPIVFTKLGQLSRLSGRV